MFYSPYYTTTNNLRRRLINCDKGEAVDTRHRRSPSVVICGLQCRGWIILLPVSGPISTLQNGNY